MNLNYRSFSRITVVGHSAGAHLAALLLKVNWTLLGIPNNPVRGKLLCVVNTQYYFLFLPFLLSIKL